MAIGALLPMGCGGGEGGVGCDNLSRDTPSGGVAVPWPDTQIHPNTPSNPGMNHHWPMASGALLPFAVVTLWATELEFKIYCDFRFDNYKVFWMGITSIGYFYSIIYRLLYVTFIIIKITFSKGLWSYFVENAHFTFRINIPCGRFDIYII